MSVCAGVVRHGTYRLLNCDLVSDVYILWREPHQMLPVCFIMVLSQLLKAHEMWGKIVHVHTLQMSL
jgi:hypothetical protein